MEENRPKKTKKPEIIKGGYTVRVGAPGGVSHPALIYDGDKPPEVGSKIQFLLANGVIYTGVVGDTTGADGSILVEFKDSISPVPVQTATNDL